MEHPELGTVALKLKCREYVPGILAITVGLATREVRLTTPQQLIDLQQLNSSTQLRDCVVATLSLWSSRTGKVNRLPIPRHFPCLDVEVLDAGEYENFLKTSRTGIVGALIRNPGYETMDQSIVDEIFAKNVELNKKTNQRLLLADKQGILQIRSAGDSLYSSQDLPKVHDLAEMALISAQLLDQTWSFRGVRPDLTDFALLKVLDWIQTPQAHLSDSVSNLKLWDLLSEEFHLGAKAKSVIEIFSSEFERKRAVFSSRRPRGS